MSEAISAVSKAIPPAETIFSASFNGRKRNAVRQSDVGVGFCRSQGAFWLRKGSLLAERRHDLNSAFFSFVFSLPTRKYRGVSRPNSANDVTKHTAPTQYRSDEMKRRRALGQLLGNRIHFFRLFLLHRSWPRQIFKQRGIDRNTWEVCDTEEGMPFRPGICESEAKNRHPENIRWKRELRGSEVISRILPNDRLEGRFGALSTFLVHNLFFVYLRLGRDIKDVGDEIAPFT